MLFPSNVASHIPLCNQSVPIFGVHVISSLGYSTYRVGDFFLTVESPTGAKVLSVKTIEMLLVMYSFVKGNVYDPLSTNSRHSKPG